MRFYVKIILKPYNNPRDKFKVQKTQFLLSKVRCLKPCPLALLMPLEENPSIEPHLKALISGQRF